MTFQANKITKTVGPKAGTYPKEDTPTQPLQRPHHDACMCMSHRATPRDSPS